jgi:predicted enzyme related to lactoylglutathione lyase
MGSNSTEVTMGSKKKWEERKNPTVVHFEIPADDVERARKFYSTLFGWKIEKAEVKKDGDSMDYWMISTSGVSNDKSLGGGIMKRQDPQQPNLNYIGVDSIDEYSRKIGELGGKVVMPKTEISDYGYFAVCMDTENNAFALWEHIDPGQR